MAASFDREDSQKTFISLMELDPTPIESPKPQEKNRGFITPEDMNDGDMDSSESTLKASMASTGSTTSAPGLSGNGHGAIYYLSRVQRYSSYAMSIFTSLHLTNVSLIPAVTRSVPGSETYLLMTREIYQTTFTEPLLVALPFIAHVGSGVALRLLRWRQNRRRYGGATPAMYALHRSRATASGGHSVRIWPQMSYISISGYIFTVFYSAHVFMNRVLPLAVEGDSSNIGLAYVAHGFARHPWMARLAYIGLIGLGSGHMIWGLAKWFGYAPSTSGWQTNGSSTLEDKATKKQRKRKWLSVQAAVVGGIVAWGIGGMAVVSRGGLQDGWLGDVYDGLFGRVGF